MHVTAICLACPSCTCSPSCLQPYHHDELHVDRRVLGVFKHTHSLFARQVSFHDKNDMIVRHMQRVVCQGCSIGCHSTKDGINIALMPFNPKFAKSAHAPVLSAA